MYGVLAQIAGQGISGLTARTAQGGLILGPKQHQLTNMHEELKKIASRDWNCVLLLLCCRRLRRRLQQSPDCQPAALHCVLAPWFGGGTSTATQPVRWQAGSWGPVGSLSTRGTPHRTSTCMTDVVPAVPQRASVCDQQVQSVGALSCCCHPRPRLLPSSIHRFLPVSNCASFFSPVLLLVTYNRIHLLLLFPFLGPFLSRAYTASLPPPPPSPPSPPRSAWALFALLR